MATTIGQYIYKVLDTVSGKTITTDNFNPTKEVTGNFTKLSFQAPTGTNIIINDKTTVIVGRSGYYEVPEGIIVQKFKMEAGMIYTPSLVDESIYNNLAEKVGELSSAIEKAKSDSSIIDNNDFEIAYQEYQAALEAKPKATTSVPLENIIIDYVIESKDGAQVVDNSSIISNGGEN